MVYRRRKLSGFRLLPSGLWKKEWPAFLFDYRTFGQSDGEPRHLVNPFHHIQDWLAAIAHVRNLPEVDTNRIALWGTSFSGGHVIIAAAKDAGITSGGISGSFCQRIFFNQAEKRFRYNSCDMLWDGGLYTNCVFLTPHYSPAIAQPGTFAAMNSEESYPGFRSIIPEGSNWENKMTSRAFILLAFYYPIYYAKKVKAPVLLIGGKNDSLVPFSAVQKTAKRLPNCEFVVLECNHFEPYTGARFEQSIKIQIDFLERKL